ncbi:HTH_Tnp_Tc3_2 domain-containing protein [Trichonephila clavipes]|nr:HTH_Tnp_Tc3_2 domain-containing protein [Trichonephila clavipes]
MDLVAQIFITSETIRDTPSIYEQARQSMTHREIGSRVGRNQTTVMRICDRWMQEGTVDQPGRSHTPQCTISREDRQIGRMTVRDHSITSRTAAKPIESATHHSVHARTIRRRLQQSGLSARCP